MHRSRVVPGWDWSGSGSGPVALDSAIAQAAGGSVSALTVADSTPARVVGDPVSPIVAPVMTRWRSYIEVGCVVNRNWA